MVDRVVPSVFFRGALPDVGGVVHSHDLGGGGDCAVVSHGSEDARGVGVQTRRERARRLLPARGHLHRAPHHRAAAHHGVDQHLRGARAALPGQRALEGGAEGGVKVWVGEGGEGQVRKRHLSVHVHPHRHRVLCAREAVAHEAAGAVALAAVWGGGVEADCICIAFVRPGKALVLIWRGRACGHVRGRCEGWGSRRRSGGRR
mmetsp:Transcript_39124/g.73397  ORF Transcript_39124/g.73397 Transcript_39124/m.73397 type:complete len:203 (+) Transcript_39124:1-609(+)